MTDHTFLESMLVINPGALDRVVGRETLVVTGAPRGMTSVVSYTLFELGYFLGDKIQPRNFEDVGFTKALPDPKLFPKPLTERRVLIDLIAERNAAHDRWGFKLPRALHYIEQLPALLRNPVVVLCVRNPLATCASVATRESGLSDGLATGYRNALRSVTAMEHLMSASDLPSILVDMDSVQRRPGRFLRDFAKLLKLEGDLDAIKAGIAEPGYKRAAKQPGVTYVNAKGDPI
ncbi:hypothetical protein ROJ8625_00856 [Roseivivax jejudonensis]|uniref:Sulfotransferase family protein n=1 Tax=Roseivivax jejudonensis TaxID=1529041 RepID=A0A1X6YIR0_9RHOB|nr:hypothetical protein [Roseivivax jejudonensis]SLN22053.1 hypothetical protein ROJ8625_00856 [Roseivivax jejudonensis]